MYKKTVLCNTRLKPLIYILCKFCNQNITKWCCRKKSSKFIIPTELFSINYYYFVPLARQENKTMFFLPLGTTCSTWTRSWLSFFNPLSGTKRKKTQTLCVVTGQTMPKLFSKDKFILKRFANVAADAVTCRMLMG